MNDDIDDGCFPNQRVLTQVLIFYPQILGARRTLWLGDYYFNGNTFWQPDKTSFIGRIIGACCDMKCD